MGVAVQDHAALVPPLQLPALDLATHPNHTCQNQNLRHRLRPLPLAAHARRPHQRKSQSRRRHRLRLLPLAAHARRLQVHVQYQQSSLLLALAPRHAHANRQTNQPPRQRRLLAQLVVARRQRGEALAQLLVARRLHANQQTNPLHQLVLVHVQLLLRAELAAVQHTDCVRLNEQQVLREVTPGEQVVLEEVAVDVLAA